jgi:aspartate aminotransferase
MRLSRFVNEMSEAATLRMAQLARDARARGVDVVDLTIGEPDFTTPEHIRAAAKQALDEGRTRYSPVAGLAELRDAICLKLNRDNGLKVCAEQVVVSNGAKQSIANACLAVLDPGDEVLLPAPYWVSYLGLIKLAGAVPVAIATGVQQQFKVRPAQLLEAITPRTRMLLFSNPCNPTGAVYTPQELDDIARALEPHTRIMIVADEIYELINFSGAHSSIGAIASLRERVITVNGFSKGYAMTGWRLGYLAAPAEIAAACIKIQGQFTSGACTFNQAAAVRALLGDQAPTASMRDSFRRRRDRAVALLQRIPGIQISAPDGAFYLFPDVSAHLGRCDQGLPLANADDFCQFLLRRAGVATVPGSAFGDPRCIRLSIAAAEADLDRGIVAIEQAISRLSSPTRP